MVWNGKEWNRNFGMEYGRCQNGRFQEWNGRQSSIYSILDFGMEFWYGTEILVWNMEDVRMEDFKNGMEDNLPYFHTRFRALYLEKNTYRCRLVINNTVTEVFNFNISTHIICRQISVLW